LMMLAGTGMLIIGLTSVFLTTSEQDVYDDVICPPSWAPRWETPNPYTTTGAVQMSNMSPVINNGIYHYRELNNRKYIF